VLTYSVRRPAALVVLPMLVLAGVAARATDIRHDNPKSISPHLERAEAEEVETGPLVTTPPLPREFLTRGGFSSVQVNVNAAGNNIVGDAANEPSLAVDPTRKNRIVVGWRQFNTVSSNFRQAGRAWSRDNGRTWTFPGVLTPGTFRSDPVVESDSAGNFYYLSLQGTFQCDVFKSTDGGQTFGAPVPAFGGDKEWFTIDKSGGIGDGHIYVYWQVNGNPYYPNQFTRSINGGASFQSPIPLTNEPVFGTLAVGPDGELYLCGDPFGSGGFFRVLRSDTARDPAQAVTWSRNVAVNMLGELSFGGPNPDGLLGQAWVDVDRSNGPRRGWVYLMASVQPNNSGDPLELRFSRSTNGGQTWSAPIRVNDDPANRNAYQWFGTMSVAPNGRIDAIWNDTRNDANPSNPTFSELFYSYSEDGGFTWSPNVAVSPPFNHFLGYPQQNKLGDYSDMQSDAVGADVVYAATFNGEQDVYYLRIGDYDCNGNDAGDADDIALGTSDDVNADGIPDECQCLRDLDGNGSIGLGDLSALLTNYGTSSGATPEDGDLDGDGDVDLADLSAVLEAFGAGCP